MLTIPWLRRFKRRKNRKSSDQAKEAMVPTHISTEPLEERVLLASQLISATATDTSLTANPTQTTDVTVQYETTDPVGTKTTGISLQTFFNGNELEDPTNLQNLFPGALLQNLVVGDDTNDIDGDATTTRLFTFIWNDAGGNFPVGADEVDLFTVTFETKGAFDGNAINFRRAADSFSGGQLVDFTSNSLNLTLAAAPAPIVRINNGGQRTEGDADPFGFQVIVDNLANGQNLSVDVTTGDGAAPTATYGDDYNVTGQPTRETTTLNFTGTGAQLSQIYNVNVVDDQDVENTEFFVATLSNVQGPAGSSINANADTGTASILDNDVAPVIPQIDLSAGPTVEEGNPLNFDVTLSEASGETVTVRVRTIDGTAVAPGDYTAIADQLITFDPGVTTQSFSTLR